MNNRWLSVAVLVLLVLVSAVTIRRVLNPPSADAGQLLITNGPPVPPTPWKNGPPVPPTPWNR